MEDPVWASFIVWSAWLLIAIVIDGLLIPFKLIISHRSRRKTKNNINDDLPRVSVVVPAHNEEGNIERCLISLINNDYPQDKLEIIVVDDGSKDDTTNIVKQCKVDAIARRKKLKLIEKMHTGKVHTLNTGLRQITGDIIITIDADARLAPDAIRNIVTPFVEDGNVGAATGYVEIQWDGTKKENFWKMFLSKCEFLEYLSSFNVERNYQSFIDSIYTMSGAFSAFRRNIIGKIGGYWPVTVSEDTYATMMLHKNKVDIVNVPEAVAVVDAITDYDTLYSQRVRWARGQLEVAAMHQDSLSGEYLRTSCMDILSIARDQKDPKLLKLFFSSVAGKISDKICGLADRTYRSFGLLGLPRILFVDHTIAFPRLMWVFVLLMFPVLGLYINLLPLVIVLMYLFYVVVESLVILFAYHHSNDATRLKIEESYHYVLLLPLYRLITFCFRVSAFLHILKEPPGWKVNGPVNGFKNGLNNVKNGINGNAITTIFQIRHLFNFIALIKNRGK